MANTGFGRLRFTGALNKHHPEARKFAVHADRILEDAVEAVDFSALIADVDLLVGLSPRTPWADGKSLSWSDFPARAAAWGRAGRSVGLLFGNEAHGLSNHDLAHCHFRLAIPTHDHYVSMNLAQAVLVVLWELFGALRGTEVSPPPAPPEWVSMAEKDLLLDGLKGFLEQMAFLNPQNPDHLWREIVPIFRSRDWTQREWQLLIAMFQKGRSRYEALKVKPAPSGHKPDRE